MVLLLYRLGGLWFTYLLFEAVGRYVFEQDFSASLLFSIVMLPALAILKDVKKVVQPFFIKVRLDGDAIETVDGIYTVRNDRLLLKDVVNTEVRQSRIGACFNYADIWVGAYGTFVLAQNVSDPHDFHERLKKRIETLKAIEAEAAPNSKAA